MADRNPVTGQTSYPGSSKDPVPAGCVRETLSTIDQVDRFCRARSEEETSKRRDQIRAEREYWKWRVQERRQWVAAGDEAARHARRLLRPNHSGTVIRSLAVCQWRATALLNVLN